MRLHDYDPKTGGCKCGWVSSIHSNPPAIVPMLDIILMPHRGIRIFRQFRVTVPRDASSHQIDALIHQTAQRFAWPHCLRLFGPTYEDIRFAPRVVYESASSKD